MWKKSLGTILVNKGFCTREQVDFCIEKQQRLYMNIMPEKFLGNVGIVAEARSATGKELLLGELMVLHAFITAEQLAEALEEQNTSDNPIKFIKASDIKKIFDINSVINKGMNLTVVLSAIMNHINKVTGSTAGTLMMLEEETGELVFSVPTGPEKGKLTDIRLKPGEGVAGWVVTHEQPVLLNNMDDDNRPTSRIDHFSGFDTRNLICVPLVTRGKVIGVFEVLNKSDNDDFTQEDLLLLQLFANKAAIAIDNARMFHNLELLNNDLQKQVKRKTEELETALKIQENLANLDGLTRIPNRRNFDEQMERECGRHNRQGTFFSVIMCDVDCFKLYNDHYGHPAGDECLKSIGGIIGRSVRRPCDLAARYGGEEFAVLLPDTDGPGALNIAEQIRKAVVDLQIEHATSFVGDHVTMSLGVATADDSLAVTPESILTQADKALYRAKQLGRNRVVHENLS